METGLKVFSVTFFQLALLDADEDARVAREAGLKSGIWICGRALRRRRAGRVGSLTMESIVRVKPGLSRIFLCLVRSSLSFLEIGYSGCLRGLRSRDLGLLIGPVHSVITEGMMMGTSLSLACSLTLLMLGAILGVALRPSPGVVMSPSMPVGSRQNLNGLLAGGGPGLSEKLRGPIDVAILDVRCNKG